MIKVMHQVLLSGLTVALLSGCTDNGFLFRSFGSYNDDEKSGTYKIGEPYQIKNEWYTPKEDYNYNEKGVAGWYQDEEGTLTANGEKYSEDLMTAMHKTLPLPSIVRITNLENGNVAIVRVNDRGPYVNNRLIDVSQKTAEALEFNMVGTTLVQVEILPNESKELKKEILKKQGVAADAGASGSHSVINSPVQIATLENQPLYQPEDGRTVVYGDEANTDLTAPNTVNPSGIVSITKPDFVSASEQPVISSDKPIDLVPKNEAVADSSVQNTPVTDNAIIQNAPTPVMTPVSGHYVQGGAFSNLENAEKLKSQLEQFGPVRLYDTKSGETVLHRVRMGPFESQENAAEMLNKLKQAGFDAKVIFEP